MPGSSKGWEVHGASLEVTPIPSPIHGQVHPCVWKQQPSLCCLGQSETLKHSSAVGNHTTDGYSKLYTVILDKTHHLNSSSWAGSANGIVLPVFTHKQANFSQGLHLFGGRNSTSQKHSQAPARLMLPKRDHSVFPIQSCCFLI